MCYYIMGGQDNMMNPGQELERIKASIKRYELIARTTTDPVQQKRVSRILGELRDYKERITLLFHIMDGDESVEPDDQTGDDSSGFLNLLLAKDNAKNVSDVEIHYLNLYMDFFYEEFLSFFSERKLKLDFKYSIDRDSTHHKFMEIKRRVDDLEKEEVIVKDGFFQKSMEQELRLRSIKLKRTLCIEAHKFFLWVKDFADTLIADLDSEGLLCLNGDNIITFELNFDAHYCEGLTVKNALIELRKFTEEVIVFLNIPDIEG
jgi:hypothetical protein